MHSSQYVTNQFNAQIPVRSLLTNLRKMLVAKFFSSSTRWRSRSSLVTKPYGVQTQQLLQEKDELRQILSLVTICMNTTLLNTTVLHTCATFDGPLKNPYICLGLWEKKVQTCIQGLDWNQLWKTEFHKPR